MASVDPQIPNWPIAEAVVHADGSATLTIAGKQQPITARDPATARGELVQLVRDQLATELGRPVRLHTVDPDGSEGQLAVAPDGSVTELSVRTRPRHAPSGAAPPPAAPPGPRQLRVADADADAAPQRDDVVIDEDAGGPSAPRQLRRGEVHHRQPGALQRAWRWLTDELLVSAGEKAERAEDARLSALTGASRQNLIVLVGPRGGAGKTMGARTIGGILAAARLGTVLHMDADQDYGPAADLVPDMQRSEKTIIDLLADFDEPPPPPQLRPVHVALRRRPACARRTEEAHGHEEARRRARSLRARARAAARRRRRDHGLRRRHRQGAGVGAGARRPGDRACARPTTSRPTTSPRSSATRTCGCRRARRSCSTTRARRAAATWPRSSATSPGTRSRSASASPTTTGMRLMLDQATYRLAALPRDTRLPLKRLAATVGEGLR